MEAELAGLQCYDDAGRLAVVLRRRDHLEVVYRDQLPSCLICKVELEVFKVVGLSYGLCPTCGGAWVRLAELSRMFDVMSPLADAVLERVADSKRQCLDCKATMVLSHLSAGYDRSSELGRGWVWRVVAPVPAIRSIGLNIRYSDGRREIVIRSEPVIKVGRLGSCQLRLDDDTVSRMHAVIELENPPIIVDLGSGSGTIVNGRRINKAKLRPGDVISLGDNELAVLPSPNKLAPEEPTNHLHRASASDVESISPLCIEVDVCKRHGIWFDRKELQAALAAAGGAEEAD